LYIYPLTPIEVARVPAFGRIHYINLAVNVAMGFFPLHMVLGRPPCWFEDSFSPTSNHPALSKWFRIRHKQCANTRDTLCVSRIKQAAQQKHTLPSAQLDVGSWVILNSADWRDPGNPAATS
jgi:hypothetical protein